MGLFAKTLLLLIGLALGLAWLPARAADYYILGVQDYVKNPILVVRDYQGLANYLSKIVKTPVRIEAVKTYDDYIKKAAAKRFHFMYAPPSMIMKAHFAAGYEPVVKIPGLLSASFVTMDTNIAFPEDMKGKRIGFYEKDAMITQMAFKDLQAAGIDPATYFKSVTYYKDSNGVLNAMQYKLIDIGVANSSLYNNWTNRGYNLVLVLQGKGVPHLTFAVRGDLPTATKQAVTQALLKAQNDKDGQDYFKFSSFTNFEPAKVSDYDDLVKFLGITK